uniref:Integrase catalytic domain-containing protein n=1 Tax=Anopheles quadriannulatus TaxID=34691 RepID=A0A182XQ20_ANOQN
MLYAATSTSSKSACGALDQYFSYYSRPRRIISDRGTCFTSNEFTKFLSSRGVTHILTATSSPQANGQVERVNRVLRPMLSKTTDPYDHSDWSTKLRALEFALNNTVHSSTCFTPSMLLFGTDQQIINDEQFSKKHRPAIEFQVGDLVVIRNVDNSTNVNKKLIARYKRPYIIHKRLHNDRYLVRDIDRIQPTQIPYEGVLETDKLRKWTSQILLPT